MNRGNISAKLSCQVHKFLSFHFIKKLFIGLQTMVSQVQDDKKTTTQLHITVKQIFYIRKIPFKYLYTCYHIILLIKPMVYLFK